MENHMHLFGDPSKKKCAKYELDFICIASTGTFAEVQALNLIFDGFYA